MEQKIEAWRDVDIQDFEKSVFVNRNTMGSCTHKNNCDLYLMKQDWKLISGDVRETYPRMHKESKSFKKSFLKKTILKSEEKGGILKQGQTRVEQKRV